MVEDRGNFWSQNLGERTKKEDTHQILRNIRILTNTYLLRRPHLVSLAQLKLRLLSAVTISVSCGLRAEIAKRC